MGVIRIFLIIIEVVVCLLLVGVILLQKSRDSGLGMAFGAGMGESLFGAQAGNVLTRITITLAAIFLINTTLLAIIQPPRDESLVDRMLPGGPDVPPVQAPAGPAGDPAQEEAVPLMPYEFPDEPDDAVEVEAFDNDSAPIEIPDDGIVVEPLTDPIPAPIEEDPVPEWDDPLDVDVGDQPTMD